MARGHAAIAVAAVMMVAAGVVVVGRSGQDRVGYYRGRSRTR